MPLIVCNQFNFTHLQSTIPATGLFFTHIQIYPWSFDNELTMANNFLQYKNNFFMCYLFMTKWSFVSLSFHGWIAPLVLIFSQSSVPSKQWFIFQFLLRRPRIFALGQMISHSVASGLHLVASTASFYFMGILLGSKTHGLHYSLWVLRGLRSIV